MKLQVSKSTSIDVDLKEIRKIVYSMVGKELTKEGARTDCRYSLK
jgi:hypothetical protein